MEGFCSFCGIAITLKPRGVMICHACRHLSTDEAMAKYHRRKTGIGSGRPRRKLIPLPEPAPNFWKHVDADDII